MQVAGRPCHPRNLALYLRPVCHLMSLDGAGHTEPDSYDDLHHPGAARRWTVTSRRGSPTLRRRQLGMELRRLREAAGVTIEHVAERLECSGSKISRIETAQT